MASTFLGITYMAASQAQKEVTFNDAVDKIDAKFGMLSKSVAGGIDVALSAAEAANMYVAMSGVLTGNISVTVPTLGFGLWVLFNNSSGAFTITFKPAPSGTGIVVAQGKRAIVLCDGTNVVRVTADT